MRILVLAHRVACEAIPSLPIDGRPIAPPMTRNCSGWPITTSIYSWVTFGPIRALESFPRRTL